MSSVGKQKSATIEPLVKLRILDLYFGGKTAKEISRYLDIPFISVNRFIKHFNEYNQTFEIPITLSRARLIHQALQRYMQEELAEFGHFDTAGDYIPVIWQHISTLAPECEPEAEVQRQSYFNALKLCEQWQAVDTQILEIMNHANHE